MHHQERAGDSNPLESVELSDGVILLRPPGAGDRDALIATRDQQFHRFMGQGSPDPQPTFCITVGGDVVGWVDYETGPTWLRPGEVNVGYALHPDARGKGYATRAVLLLLQHLACVPEVHVARLRIDRENGPSLAVARRCGFEEEQGSLYFKKALSNNSIQLSCATARTNAGTSQFYRCCSCP